MVEGSPNCVKSRSCADKGRVGLGLKDAPCESQWIRHSMGALPAVCFGQPNQLHDMTLPCASLIEQIRRCIIICNKMIQLSGILRSPIRQVWTVQTLHVELNIRLP